MTEKKEKDILRLTDTIKTAKELCKVLMLEDIPTFVEGPPGVGKSEMWRQIAAELGIGFMDLRLAQLDPVDLRGLPRHQQNKDVWTSSWSRPDFWPVEERDGKRGILLLDELADCSRAMQSAAYQVVLDGRAGPHIIPPGWFRCAASNSREHKAGAQQVSTALANRFAWVNIVADAECLYEYGTAHGWHHFVLGYLKVRPAHVHTMEGGTEKAFASPRSWEKVARGGICDAPPGLRHRLIAANIGAGVASEFEGYLKLLNLPSMDDILKDPTGCQIPEAPSSRYALSSMISRYLTRDNFGKATKYLTRGGFGRDFEICCVLEASTRDPSLCETKAYTQFVDRNNDLQL